MGASSTTPFRLLFDEHAPFVARCARNYGVREDDVPDIVQQVFFALHQAVGRGLNVSVSVRGFLRAVTYRTARDHRKLAMNEREVLTAKGRLEMADMAPTAEDRMHAIDVHRMTNRILDELPPELRIVLAMSDIDEMPMSEIAEVLEIPVGTGHTRLRAARRAFEHAWNEQRATGDRAVLPFMLWDARDLLHGARATPPLPPEVMDNIWRRLVETIGSSIAVAAAAGIAGGVVAAGTAKAGAVLVAKKAAVVIVAMVAGAGLYAALLSPPDTSPEAEPVVVLAGHDRAASITTAPSVSVALAPSAPSASVTAIAAVPTASAAAVSSNVSERAWLGAARDAIERQDFAAARAAIAHVRSDRFAKEREELRRLVLAYQDGGPR